MVDDTPFVRDIVSSLLAARGHRIVEADCGARALEILSHEQFDVVLLDVEMPGGIDGLQVGRSIRASALSADVMIAMHTSLERPDVDAGFADYDDFLAKPCPASVLVPSLEDLVTFRQLNGAIADAVDLGLSRSAALGRSVLARRAALEAYKSRLQTVIADANALYARCRRAMGE